MIKYKKLSKRFGGGGGTSTASNIPSWAVPYLKDVGNEASARYNAGDLGRVAGTNPLLQTAFGSGAQGIAAQAQNAMTQGGAQQARITDLATNAMGMTAPASALYAAQAGIGQGIAQPGQYNPQMAQAGAQAGRLQNLAASGGYDTSALKDAAVLEAQKATANLGAQYGARGTLGSARQAVQQGAQNAALQAQFAQIDQAAAQQNFANKMAAEAALQQGIGQQQGLTTADLAARTQGANLMGTAAQGLLGASGQGYNQALAAEGALGQSLDRTLGAASTGTKAFSELGTQAQGVQQSQLDAPWQALQRYASTIYGNPARQQTTASGGK